MKTIFLDIEATGLDTGRHKPIDIACKIVDVASGEELGSYESLIKISESEWEQRNLASMEINGLTWEDTQNGKEPHVVAKEIIDLFTNAGIQRLKAVFICQNPSFDRGFFTQLIDIYTQENLNWPYHWLDFASMYWALIAKKNAEIGHPFPDEINLSKNEIARLNNLPPEKEPHRAMRGVEHLISCYSKVVGFRG